MKPEGLPFLPHPISGKWSPSHSFGRLIMRLVNHLRLPLLFLAAALIPMLFPGIAPYLELRIASPAEPSLLFRCFSAHLVHFTSAHFFYDAFVFVVLGWLVCREKEEEFVPLVLFSSFVISLCVWIICRELYVYRGLSGIDCALFGWLAVRYLPQKKGIIVPLLAAFCLKTIWECVTGTALFAGSDVFEAVPEAHLAGCLCGILLSGKCVPRRIGGCRDAVGFRFRSLRE